MIARNARLTRAWKENASLRAEVARIQPPTREEVEHAVAELEGALDAVDDACRYYESPTEPHHHGYADVETARARAAAARDALVKLSTRGKEHHVTGETSDGYHTFNELYAHRTALWKAVCRFAGGAWRARCHSDGTSLPGWFVLGLGTSPGEQCTYHLPDHEWESCAFARTLNLAPAFDGHTAVDVLKRLDSLHPPTREQVEVAIKKMLDARDRAFRWPFESSGYQAAITAALEADEDLIRLATREAPPAKGGSLC